MGNSLKKCLGNFGFAAFGRFVRATERKTNCRRGETISEVLCAVLVASIAMALLGGMLGAASRLNAMAKEKDKEMYAALSAAEAMTTELAASTEAGSGTGTPITITVSVGSESGSGIGTTSETVSFNVKFYGVAGTLVSYKAE